MEARENNISRLKFTGCKKEMLPQRVLEDLESFGLNLHGSKKWRKEIMEGDMRFLKREIWVISGNITILERGIKEFICWREKINSRCLYECW